MPGILKCALRWMICSLFMLSLSGLSYAQSASQPNDGNDMQRRLGVGLELSKDLIAEFKDPSLTGCPVGGGSLVLFDRGLALSIPSIFLSNDNEAIVATSSESDRVIWKFITRTCAVEITVMLKSLKDGQMSYQPVVMPEVGDGH